MKYSFFTVPERTHRAKHSHGTRKNAVFRFFQKGDDLFACDTGEVFKKFINRVAALKVIDEILNRYPRTYKTGRTAHDFRIDFDD